MFLYIPGVVRFVRYVDNDATIPESQINAIRMAIDESIDMDVTEIQFSEGEDIQIISGPFRGLFGKIIQYKSRKKIMISIDIIGKTILLESGNTRIEKVAETGR